MKIRKAGEGHDLRDRKRLKGAPRGKGGKRSSAKRLNGQGGLRKKQRTQRG